MFLFQSVFSSNFMFNPLNFRYFQEARKQKKAKKTYKKNAKMPSTAEDFKNVMKRLGAHRKEQ